MTMPPKGAENGKNEENRLKIDKIWLFLPFTQKAVFIFVLFSYHNQDNFHASNFQTESCPSYYLSETYIPIDNLKYIIKELLATNNLLDLSIPFLSILYLVHLNILNHIIHHHKLLHSFPKCLPL